MLLWQLVLSMWPEVNNPECNAAVVYLGGFSAFTVYRAKQAGLSPSPFWLFLKNHQFPKIPTKGLCWEPLFQSREKRLRSSAGLAAGPRPLAGRTQCPGEEQRGAAHLVSCPVPSFVVWYHPSCWASTALRWSRLAFYMTQDTCMS